MNVSELKTRLEQGENILLLDVREDDEYQITHLPNSTHIPMNLIPLRHNELPDDCTIVVYCHHGIRSLNVVKYLQNVGFENVHNLSGGIDAWTVQIDPKTPRY